jgi:FAD/FMN-containing dehydrogenase
MTPPAAMPTNDPQENLGTLGPAGLQLLLDRLRRALGPEHVEEVQDGGRPHIRCAPASAAEVGEVLEAAAVGGVRASVRGAREALLHLSLHRLSAVLSVDNVSLLCEVQAGALLGDVERHLRGVGLSLGPLPPLSLGRTLGAALSAPRPVEAAPATGRLRDRPARLYAVLPEAGARREVPLPRCLAPRRAAGPDLKQLLIGARGAFGVITSASLGVVRLAALSRCGGWLFPEGEAAISSLCALWAAHGGIGPTDMQVVSRDVLLQLAGQAPALPPGEAALLVRADGPVGWVEATLLSAGATCAARGGQELPDTLAQAWLLPDPTAGPSAWPAAAARWPALQRALPMAPQVLKEAFAAAAGPRVLCGVHLHGAALCAGGLPEERVSAQRAQEAAAEGLILDTMRRRLDPRSILC